MNNAVKDGGIAAALGDAYFVVIPSTMSVMGVNPLMFAAFNVDAVSALLVPFLFKLLGAAALWIVGGWLIGLALRLLKRFFRQGTLDPTLANYLLGIIGVLLRVVLVVAILDVIP